VVSEYWRASSDGRVVLIQKWVMEVGANSCKLLCDDLLETLATNASTRTFHLSLHVLLRNAPTFVAQFLIFHSRPSTVPRDTTSHHAKPYHYAELYHDGPRSVCETNISDTMSSTRLSSS
jgi:hypothetical protein